MEENLWVKGSLELLEHGLEHIKEGNEFDLRIAMITIDNAAELAIKTFLAKNRRTLKLSREELNKANKNFTNLLDTLSRCASNKISDEILDAIEHYHKIRNNLYHNGIGITVEKRYTEIYSILIENLIDLLFDVHIKGILEVSKMSILFKKSGEFIISWAKIEIELRKLLSEIDGIKRFHYNFSDIITVLTKNNILSKALVTRIHYLNHGKNIVIHGQKEFSVDELERYIGIADEVYRELLLNNK